MIDAWTALEAYVDNVLECALQKGGVSIADAKKLLDLRATYQPTTMRELVERANIEAKVRAGLRRAFGLKLAEDSVFWDDFKKKQEIRNEAVHGGSSPKLKMSVETLNIVRHIVDKVEAVAGEC
ncbi:MAG: hypothetical protein FJ317_06260 [SAR202 cluster bacterium]|nr:hypothetical protein [SAR202 cluster bacterium]